MLRKKESNTGLKTIWKVLRVKAVLFSTAKKEKEVYLKKKKKTWSWGISSCDYR